MLMTTDGRSLGTADERRNVKCRDPQNGHRSTDLVHLSYSVCPMSDTTVLHNRCSTSSLKVCELKSLLHGNSRIFKPKSSAINLPDNTNHANVNLINLD